MTNSILKQFESQLKKSSVDLLGDFLGKIDLFALEIPQSQKFFAKCCFKLELSYLDRLNKKLNLDSLFIGALNNHLEACNK